MSIDQKRLIERQLWNIADTLRGKMDADDFRDYILGFKTIHKIWHHVGQFNF